MTSMLADPKAKKSQTADLVFRAENQVLKFTRPDAVVYNGLRGDAPLIDESAAEVAKSGAMPREIADGFMFDVAGALSRVAPKVSGMGDTLAQELMRRLRESAEYEATRSYTVGDDVASALAACAAGPRIVEAVTKEMREAAAKQRAAEDKVRDADGYAEALRSLDTTGPNEQAHADERAREARAALDAATVRLRVAMRDGGKELAKGAAAALVQGREAAENAKAAEAFGFGNGTADVNGGLSVDQKVKLANLIGSSGPAFRKFVDMLGRLSREAARKQATRDQHDAGEVVDVKLGSEISELMEDEVALLSSPNRVLRLEAMSRLVSDSMGVYEVEQKETSVKGDVVVLIDESGSMQGQKEAEAKAVALALAQICIRQRRRLAVLFFQSTVTFRVEFAPGDGDSVETGVSVAIRKLGAIASRGTAGGTSFDAPLQAACDEVTNGGVMARADVLMITDGICRVSGETLARIAAVKSKPGARFYSVLIGQGDASVLKQFSDRTWVCGSMMDGAAGDIFGEI